MKELIKKLRKYEIRIRKAINTQMQGNFHSIFKGSGLEFDDVRTYQYGDDIRHIDWNVSAKGHGTFVKNFKEEKEQNIFFIIDVSASQNIGRKTAQKLDIAKEICGVLVFSSLKEDSSTGLVCFSNQKERYICPRKGLKHVYFLINTLFKIQTKSPHTNLKAALDFTLSTIKRKSIMIILSDFIDENYQRNLKAMAARHDLIVIHISDEKEQSFPSVGIIPLYDKETKKTTWINTSSFTFRNKFNKYFKQKHQDLANLCKRNNANYLYINTKEDYVPQLIKLFKIRNRRN